MATVLITPSDLAPFADIDADKAEAMIEDATAMALRVAPCLKTTSDEDVIAAAKAILRASILRWNDAGSGGTTQKQQTSGPFSTSGTFVSSRKSMFWPSEIADLQGLCDATSGRAFEVDLMPADAMSRKMGHWKSPTEWVYDL